MDLSPRLHAALSLVLPDRPVLDLGTDHGLLAAALVRDDRVPKVIAADRSRAALRAGQRRWRGQPSEDRIEWRHGDGLHVVSAGEVATVTMAGFGGQAMLRVLARGPVAGIERFVLQPQLDLDAVRRWLYAHGFVLDDECLVRDRGQFYVWLVARPPDVPLESIASPVDSPRTANGSTRGAETASRASGAVPCPDGPLLQANDFAFGPWLRRRGGSLFVDYLRAEEARVVTAVTRARTANVDDARLTPLLDRRHMIHALLEEQGT